MIYTIPEDASEKALTLLKHKAIDTEMLRDSIDRRYRRKRFHIMGLKGEVQFPFFPDELPREWFYAADGTRIEYERDLYRLYADRVLTFSVEPLKEARIERGGFIPSDMGVLRMKVSLDCDAPAKILTEMVRLYLRDNFGLTQRDYYNYEARAESPNSWGVYVYHDLNRFLEDPRLFAGLISGACDDEFPAETFLWNDAPFCGLFAQYPVCGSALKALSGHLEKGEPMALVSAWGQGPELRNRQMTKELQMLAGFARLDTFSLFGSYDSGAEDGDRETPREPEDREAMRRWMLDEAYSCRLDPVGSRIFGRDNIDKEIVTALCSGPEDEEYLHGLAIGLAERYGQEKVLLADCRGKAHIYYTRDATDPSGAPVSEGTSYCPGDMRTEPEKVLQAFMARPGKRLFRISADERYSDSVADLCIGGYNRSRAFWILNPDRLRGMKGQPREQVAETVKQLKGLFYYYR